MGYGLEVEMIRAAHELDLLTTPYVFSEDEAARHGRGRRRHHRLPHGPDHRRRDRRRDGADARRLRAARSMPGRRRPRKRAQGRDRALPRRPDRHAGGRRLTSSTRCPDCHGFYGASSMERLPTEIALTEQTRKFKADRRAGLQAGPEAGRSTMIGAQFGTFILGLIVVRRSSSRSSSGCCTGSICARRKERAFVRTGLGGQKVVMNGGAFVLPIVHEVIPVNMNTLRLEVPRGRDKALITKDRMRVDVVAEFYVRVQATPERHRQRRPDAGPAHHAARGAAASWSRASSSTRCAPSPPR